MKVFKKEVEKLYTLIRDEQKDQIRLFASWFTNYFGNVLEAEDVFFTKLENEKEVPVMLARSLKEAKARFLEEGKELGFEKGIEKGMEKNRNDMIIRLDSKGYNAEQISDMLDVPISLVKKITSDSSENK